MRRANATMLIENEAEPHPECMSGLDKDQLRKVIQTTGTLTFLHPDTGAAVVFDRRSVRDSLRVLLLYYAPFDGSRRFLESRISGQMMRESKGAVTNELHNRVIRNWRIDAFQIVKRIDGPQVCQQQADELLALIHDAGFEAWLWAVLQRVVGVL